MTLLKGAQSQGHIVPCINSFADAYLVSYLCGIVWGPTVAGLGEEQHIGN